MQRLEQFNVRRLEQLAFLFEMAWDFYQLEQSLGIPEESPPDLDDYQHLLELDPVTEEPPKVKHISRFFKAIRTWLDENPVANDGAFVSPGGWLA